MAEGFFFPNANPEQEALARRQALADAIMQRGMAPPGNSPGAGFAHAGSSIAGALLAKRLGDKAKDLETTREGSYSKALGNFLSPFDYGGAPNADTGVPDNVNVSPQASAAIAGQLGSSMGARLAATGNTDLQRQVAPQVLAQALQANQPITPYQQAELAQQQRTTDPAYLARVKALPGPLAQAKPQDVIDQENAQADAAAKRQLANEQTLKGTPGAPTQGMSPEALQQQIELDKAKAQATVQAQMGAFAAPGGGASSGLTGDEYLKTLNPQIAGQVKMLAEGKLAIPSGNALRAPYWQQLLQAANQYDPSLDQASAGARFKTRNAFSAGPESKTINNLNTAIGHAGTLLDQIPGTAGHSGFPFATTVNALENSYNTRSGNPGVPLFKDTAGKLAQELTAVYRGGGGAEKDVVRGLESLDENASTETKKAILNNAVDLLSSKMDALGEQYNRGMGTTKDPLELINPHAAATFQKLKGGGAAQTAPKAGADPQAIVDELRRRGVIK